MECPSLPQEVYFETFKGTILRQGACSVATAGWIEFCGRMQVGKVEHFLSVQIKDWLLVRASCNLHNQ